MSTETSEAYAIGRGYAIEEFGRGLDWQTLKDIFCDETAHAISDWLKRDQYCRPKPGEEHGFLADVLRGFADVIEHGDLGEGQPAVRATVRL